WAQYRTLVAGREQEGHFAVNTLGYSRRFHFVAMACEDAEHTYESLIQSFEYFGAVTAEVLVDNQKTEVISHRIGAAVEYKCALFWRWPHTMAFSRGPAGHGARAPR